MIVAAHECNLCKDVLYENVWNFTLRRLTAVTSLYVWIDVTGFQINNLTYQVVSSSVQDHIRVTLWEEIKERQDDNIVD